MITTTDRTMMDEGRAPRAARMLRVLRRGASLIVTAGLLSAAVAAGAGSMLPVRHVAEATVLVDARQAAYPSGDSQDRAAAERALADARVQILSSPDFARQIARLYALADRAEFAAPSPGPVDRLLISLGMAEDPSRISPEERAIAGFRARFAFAPSVDARVLTIRFESADPQTAVAVANGVADRFRAVVAEGGPDPVEVRVLSEALSATATAEWSRAAFAAGGGLLGALLVSLAVVGAAGRSASTADAQDDEPCVPRVVPVDAVTAEADDAAALPSVVRRAAFGKSAGPARSVGELHILLLRDGASRIAFVEVDAAGAGTEVAMSFARHVAVEGARVVVVDLASGRTGPAVVGLADLMDGTAAFGETIRLDRASRAHVIGPGSRDLDQSALAGADLESTLGALEHAYDLVVLDLGRAIGDPGRFSLVASADRVVLVGDPAHCGVAAAHAALSAAGIARIDLLAADLVLNEAA